MLRVVLRVDDGSLVNVLKPPLCSELMDIGGVSNEDQIGDVVSQYSVGCFKGTLLFCLGEHDALLVGFRTCNDLL